MRNVLITGGAGFVGSHLADYHIKKGDKVHVIDDLSTGNAHNIDALKKNLNFGYSLDTIMNKQLLAELVDNADWVYHLAAAVGVRLVVESPVRTIETNIGGTQVILQMCEKKKKKLLIASTSEVYGKSTDFPFREDGDILLGPTSVGRWSYASSKAIDEFLAIAYFREKKCPVVVARLFNTIGPRQTGDYGMVVPRFIRAALSGADLEVYGTGAQSRCFTNVKDVVRILPLMMENDVCMGEVFNIGSAQEITILDLAKKIILLCASKSRVKQLSYETAYGKGFEDMQRRIPSQEKLKKFLNVHPEIGLEETLKEMVEFERLRKD